MLLIATGFLLSLTGILVISKKNLALGLIGGSLILGFFTLPPGVVFEQVIGTLADPSIITLALAMGVIPLLGGTMKGSGQVDSLVGNIRLPQRVLLPVSTALMGLLPMPGGALLSAPILERGGEGVSDELKALINNWFRHVFILIYPLSPALIVSAKIADLDVYLAILYILPAFVLALVLGHLFYLRKIDGRPPRREGTSWLGLSLPLMIILSAPTLDFLLKRFLSMGPLATLTGVTVALALSLVLSPVRIDLGKTALQMKPWNFSLIIIGMFLYLHIFRKSDARALIAGVPLSPLTLSIAAGFFLAVVTGRVQLPASIVLPVYLATAGKISPFLFALIYVGVYFGYIFSPVHPCLVVTCEYFHVSIRTIIGKLALPTMMIFAAVFTISLFVA